jgi:hypothetical protein
MMLMISYLRTINEEYYVRILAKSRYVGIDTTLQNTGRLSSSSSYVSDRNGLVRHEPVDVDRVNQ